MLDVRVKPDEKANMSCAVTGYPYSNISFTFFHCDTEKSCYGKPESLVNDKFKLVKLSFASK